MAKQLLSSKIGVLLGRSLRFRASAAAAFVAVALSATSAVFALDYTPHGTQPGLLWDLEDASGCSDCHRGDSATNLPFMPHSSWAGSMMANATRDPLFWAALDIANHDAASIGKAGVGDYCLRCHTPRGWLNGDVVKPGFLGTGGTGGETGCKLQGGYGAHESSSNDYSGVDCHYCHRLMPTGPAGQPGMIGNANAWVDNATSCTNEDGSLYGGPCRRGPFAYTSAFDPLQPPHGWTYSSYHVSSALCGSCHDVSSPDTDAGPLKTLVRANGSDSGRPFPIERTYTEWTRSRFAETIFRDAFGDTLSGLPALARSKQCQDCHMRNSNDAQAQACLQNPPGSRTGELPVHEFAGANTWVPSIIKAEYSSTLGSGRSEDYDRTIAAAQAMLQSSAQVQAAVTSYTAPVGATPGSLGLRVDVTNLSGHKLPTGYAEGRRMWLNIQVRDSTNQLVAESAAYDGASATLTTDAQARIYEVRQGVWDSGTTTCVVDNGTPQFHFVLANCVAKDNRIPPLGFRPTAPGDANGDEAAPVGAVYPETYPGSGVLVNVDRPNYAFSLPATAPPPFSMTAALYYQTASAEYIGFLRDQATANGAPSENRLCAGEPNRPFSVGPQKRSRGEFMYQLWANATNDPIQPGYGKSPPTLVTSSSAITAGVARRW